MKARGSLSRNVRVIDDHVIVNNSGGLVLLGNATEGIEEQTITKFHDVGFMDTSNFLFHDVSAQQAAQ